MKLIRSGQIDEALGKLRDWYPQIIQVDNHSFCMISYFKYHLLTSYLFMMESQFVLGAFTTVWFVFMKK